MDTMTIVEAVAVVFGLVCVWLTVKQNIWCWPTGLVQVALYVVIFYSVKLYSDLILHIIYIVMQVYGWHHWLRGGQNRSKLPVSVLKPRALLLWWGVCGIGTILLGYFMRQFTDAAAPYPDAFTTIASLIAQWLMARKKLESWWFWVSVDVVAVGVYIYKSLFMTAGLYTVFLVLAITGLFAWRRTLISDALAPAVAVESSLS